MKGDSPDTISIIERGLVRIYIITADGSKRQLRICGRGEDLPIGFSAGLADHVDYFYEVCSRVCQVRQVPRQEYIEILRSNRNLMYKKYIHLESQLRGLLAHINALEHTQSSDKVAFMLMAMAEQFGSQFRKYNPLYRLAVTQQEIADSVGLTRETTGIALKKLELRRILSRSRKNYTLYIERLEKYLNNR